MKRGLGGHTFHIGLVGGCLQGLEAAYLACEAGYHLTVIDRAPEAPAMTMAHNTHVFDVQEEPRRFREVLLGMDAILPTTEEQGTLDFLARTCQESGVVFLHDPAAYAVSSSKARSNAFFAKHNISIPKKWPECPFPVVIKPSEASGSHGVRVVSDSIALEEAVPQIKGHYGDIVIEAYHEGPLLSLEVIARQGIGLTYLITELEFDASFDCKRVYAPSKCSNDINQNFAGICMDIARHLGLNGLMDVEAIVDLQEKGLVVLEIDSRFPSQTPIAVYHASGINLLDEWVKMHAISLPVPTNGDSPGCALLEHVSVGDGCLEFIGETRLLPWPGVQVWHNGSFFGASMALTDYREDKESFKGTLIFAGVSWPDVLKKRQECLDRMASTLALRKIPDPEFCCQKIGGKE